MQNRMDITYVGKLNICSFEMAVLSREASEEMVMGIKGSPLAF